MLDNKEDTMRRYRFKQSLEKLRNNQRENQEKMNHPFQSIGNGIANVYKTINGINKARELMANNKYTPSAIGSGADSFINNTPNLGSNTISGAINSNIAGNASNIGSSPISDAINTQTGASGLASTASSVGDAANTASTASNATSGLSNIASAGSKAAPALGLVSAGGNFAKGDNVNGAMDLAKTGAMFIPGVGWAVAGAIQIAQMVRNALNKKAQQTMQKGQEENAKAQQQAQQDFAKQQQGIDEQRQQNLQNMQEQIDKQNQDTAQQQQAPQDLKQDIYNKVFSPEQIGQYGQGNIDLYNRPQVQNPDGSISTVRSKSFNIDGKETLIPTVSDDGRIMSDDEAIDNFYKTGKHLGQFNSVDEANKYAQNLHNQQEGIYTGGASDVQQQGYTGNLPNLDKQPTSMPVNYAEENNPTMSPEEMALIEQNQQNPETTQQEDIKQSLLDRFKSGLSDFGAGYQDNANTDFAHGDLMNGIVSGGAAPTQQGNAFNLGAQANKKSVMARLGELAGTGQRIMAHPLTQAAIAGGISKAAGGDIDDIAKAAFQYGSQKAAADRYYQQVTGNTDRPFLNSYTSQDVTNKRLEDAMNQRQQQWMYEQMIKKAQQDWSNQFNQEKFNYTKQQDKEKNALKRDEINTRKEYYRARGRNDRGNSVAQQNYEYKQGFNKSVGQFQKYADALSKAKEKEGFFANSNDKAAIAKAQENYDRAREFMINTYGGDFIKYAKEQGWE